MNKLILMIEGKDLDIIKDNVEMFALYIVKTKLFNLATYEQEIVKIIDKYNDNEYEQWVKLVITGLSEKKKPPTYTFTLSLHYGDTFKFKKNKYQFLFYVITIRLNLVVRKYKFYNITKHLSPALCHTYTFINNCQFLWANIPNDSSIHLLKDVCTSMVIVNPILDPHILSRQTDTPLFYISLFGDITIDLEKKFKIPTLLYHNIFHTNHLFSFELMNNESTNEDIHRLGSSSIRTNGGKKTFTYTCTPNFGIFTKTRSSKSNIEINFNNTKTPSSNQYQFYKYVSSDISGSLDTVSSIHYEMELFDHVDHGHTLKLYKKHSIRRCGNADFMISQKTKEHLFKLLNINVDDWIFTFKDNCWIYCDSNKFKNIILSCLKSIHKCNDKNGKQNHDNLLQNITLCDIKYFDVVFRHLQNISMNMTQLVDSIVVRSAKYFISLVISWMLKNGIQFSDPTYVLQHSKPIKRFFTLYQTEEIVKTNTDNQNTSFTLTMNSTIYDKITRVSWTITTKYIATISHTVYQIQSLSNHLPIQFKLMESSNYIHVILYLFYTDVPHHLNYGSYKDECIIQLPFTIGGFNNFEKIPLNSIIHDIFDWSTMKPSSFPVFFSSIHHVEFIRKVYLPHVHIDSILNHMGHNSSSSTNVPNNVNKQTTSNDSTIYDNDTNNNNNDDNDNVVIVPNTRKQGSTIFTNLLQHFKKCIKSRLSLFLLFFNSIPNTPENMSNLQRLADLSTGTVQSLKRSINDVSKIIFTKKDYEFMSNLISKQIFNKHNDSPNINPHHYTTKKNIIDTERQNPPSFNNSNNDTKKVELAKTLTTDQALIQSEEQQFQYMQHIITNISEFIETILDTEGLLLHGFPVCYNDYLYIN